MNKKHIFAFIGLLSIAGAAANAQGVKVDSLGFVQSYANTPAALLQGQLSGVRVSATDGNPNGAVSVNVRGLNSLRSDNQPLYIVDGVQLNGYATQDQQAFWQSTYAGKSYTSQLNPLAFLSLYDIESIEVLKDASATAIYGSRGANGVVIIKTRMTKSEDVAVNWRSNAVIATPAASSDALQTGVGHNHYLSIGSTKNQTAFNMSASIRDLKGVVPGSGSMYGSVKTSFDTKASQALWFGLSSVNTIGKASSTTGATLLGSPSYMLAARGIAMSADESVAGWQEDYDDNTRDIRSVTNAYLTLNFTPALSWTTNLGIDFLDTNRYIWYGNGTSFGAESNGAAAVANKTMLSYNATTKLSYNRFIANDHHIDASAGLEALGEWNKLNTMNGSDFFSHALRAKGLSIGASKANLHKFNQKYAHLAAFGQVAYNYKTLAGVSGSLRADTTPEYDSYAPELYYSAEAYVNVSTLKFRAGFGKSGKDQYIPYELISNYSSGYDFVAESGSEYYFSAKNKIVVNEFHAAVDFGVLDNRISGSLAWYDKSAVDGLTTYSFGTKGSYYWRAADREELSTIESTIANRGIEFDIKADILSGKDLKWNVYANAAYNVNQVMSVAPEDARATSLGSKVVANANALGKQISSFFGYESDGNGGYVDQTGDGKITEVDKIILGNPIPKISGALGTSLSFKGLTFDAMIDGAAGHNILNLNSLVENNPAEPYVVSSEYVEKGDFIRLSRVSLAYEIPMNIKWINSLRVSATAGNLLTLTKYSGWNPDVNCFGASAFTNGIDLGSYPMARSFVLGLSLNF